MEAKKSSESKTVMTELVLPNDTNNLGNLHGGKVLYWMDICSALAAGKHTRHVSVTAAVDNVSFKNPIKQGHVITITAQVTRTFNTSLEVHISVWAENILSGDKYQSNEAFYTFVALDKTGKPVQTPDVIPETEYEKKLYDGALRRRQLRLILGGRMKPEHAEELKALFTD